MHLHDKKYPNESSAYREARNKLLKAEIELRRHVEQVAEQRRQLPLGGEIKEDYVFEEGATDLNDTTSVRKVRLSELFQPGQNSIIIYSLMYGPKMEKPCPMCTSIVDNLTGTVQHINHRAQLVIVARSPIERIRTLARSRGWDNLRLLSSAHNSFNPDYNAENPDGSQQPSFQVFTKRDGKIYHFTSTELFWVPREPGQDPRGADMMWPLWNLLDLTPEGRGEDWRPKVSY
jgi:predicted dithiol-disulfide oxidoreductase (DUF899 family)